MGRPTVTAGTDNTKLDEPPVAATARFVLLAFILVLLSSLATQAIRAADVQIADLTNIDFGAVPPTVGELRADTTFCVAMEPRGRYSLIGRGSGPAGDFQLIERGNGVHSIDYQVQVSDRGRRFRDVLQPGISLANQRASGLLGNGRCQTQARLRVVVSGNQMQSAAPGRYQGTLSLLVVPE